MREVLWMKLHLHNYLVSSLVNYAMKPSIEIGLTNTNGFTDQPNAMHCVLSASQGHTHVLLSTAGHHSTTGHVKSTFITIYHRGRAALWHWGPTTSTKFTKTSVKHCLTLFIQVFDPTSNENEIGTDS